MSNTQFGAGRALIVNPSSIGIPAADYHAGTDGGAIAYTSGTTVTLSGTYPAITSNAQLVYIKVVPASGTPMYYINGINGIKLTHAGGVVTITGVTTPFTVGDVYELGINASFNHWADIKAVGGQTLVADNAVGSGETIPVPVGGKVNAAEGAYTDGDIAMAQFNTKGELKVILSNDIEIGAVELKDADTDNRANVKAANTGKSTATLVLATQQVGTDGTVPPTGSAKTNAPFAKITDGTSDLTLGTGTVKTVPSQIHDGTTGAGVIPTILSAKEDISSIGGEVVVADNGVGVGVTKVIPIGGKYNATPPTYTDGDVAMRQTDINGNLRTVVNSEIANDAIDAGNPIKIGGRASTAPITAVSTNDRVDAFFDVQGRQIITQKALTGTPSNVSGSASNVTILAANTARLGATIWNDSTAILYLKLGATASLTSCTVKMIADAYYEVPFGYYGIIDGIWASANGAARVTELT